MTNHIGFAAAIWSYDARERSKRTQYRQVAVAFEACASKPDVSEYGEALYDLQRTSTFYLNTVDPSRR